MKEINVLFNIRAEVLYQIKKHEAQPSVLFLIKHELRVFYKASKMIHLYPFCQCGCERIFIAVL